MAGLYFHIPFCKRICAYCDFYKSADRRYLPALLEAMHAELEARREYLGPEPVTTRYVGGGTPSLCTPEQLGALLRHAEVLFDHSALEESTLEANPDDLSPASLEAFRRVGFDRLSLGIQSLDDACLRLMNRRHTAEQAIRAVREARAAGFRNITVDLIFGVPGFGGESLRRTVEGVLALGVEHISAYHLTIEPNTAFGRRQARGEFAPVEEAESEAQYAYVEQALTGVGYEHYEISNYARPGYRARHNSAYWRGVKYLGIGPAAHSFDGEERRWAVASVKGYLDGVSYEVERLTRTDRFNEYLLTRLRTAEGLSLREVESMFGADYQRHILQQGAGWLARGVLHHEGDRLRIPTAHFLLSDAVIGALFQVKGER